MKTNFYARPFGAERQTIHCVCCFDGHRISFSTRLTVAAAKWNEKRQKAIGSPELNYRLEEIEGICTSLYNRMTSHGEISAETFKESVTNEIFRDRANSGLLIPYYERWATAQRPGIRINRQRKLTCEVLKRYAKPDVRFEDMTRKWIEGFLMHLQKKGYSYNYIGTNLKNLKAVMNAALKDKLHDNLDFKNFKRMEEDADSVYLTENEIARLETVELSGMEAKARDLFLVGYYTAMRFSDYSRLSMSDIQGGILKFTTAKTGEQVLIPANPKLVAILERYGGRSPVLSEQKLNDGIKTACEKAGIDDFVTKNITKGGRKESIWLPKYRFVSSHTARRSGATNMYKAGILSRYIMMITGHKSESSFRKYIRITKLENAETLADNPFFRG